MEKVPHPKSQTSSFLRILVVGGLGNKTQGRLLLGKNWKTDEQKAEKEKKTKRKRNETKSEK